MNLKDDLRKALLTEGKGNTYKYGCVMLYLDPPKEWWDKIQSDIDEDDLYTGTEEDPGYGRETDPHVTILYGLHDDIPDEEVEEVIKTFQPMELKLDEIGLFENEKFDVLKFNIENELLSDYNKELSKFPNTNDYPTYEAHVTIAYLKPGIGEEYLNILDNIGGLKIKPNKIVYSKSDGSKGEYSFN